MAAPFGVGFLGGIASGLFSSTFGNLLTPAKRGIMQDINQLGPNEIPDIGAIVDAFQRGLMSPAMLGWGSKIHGVSLPNAIRPEFNGHSSLWNSVAVAQLNNPSASEVTDAWARQLIDEQMWEKLMQRAKGSLATHRAMKRFHYSWLPESSLFIARNRGLIDDVQFVNFAARLGYAHDGIQERLMQLRQNTLGTGELGLLAAKQWLDLDTILAQGLLQEMPNDMEVLFNHAGLNLVKDALPFANVSVKDMSWAQLAWANHWSTLGLGTIFEMLHRFRPNRVPRFNADGLIVQPFTLQDAEQWSARNGIPPQMRDAVIAAGFRPLDRRTVFFGTQTGEIKRDEVIEIALDSGMSQADSQRWADVIDARIEWNNNAPIRALEKGVIRRTFDAAVNAYKVGVVPRQQFIGDLIFIGLSQTASESYADAIDSDMLVRRVDSVLRALKRDYLNGTMNPIELASLLGQTGISVDRQQQYVTEWGALRSLERRTAQTEKILSWYVQGILTRDITYLRLNNLGWSDVDALAYIAEAQLKIARREAQIEQTGFRNARANAAQIDRLKRQAEQQAKSLQSELRRLTPVGRLIKWYRQGSISAEYFENRLRSQGYPPEVIAEYIEEANKDGPIPKTFKRQSLSGSVAGGDAGISQIQTESGPSTGTAEQNPPGPSSSNLG